MSHYKLLIPGAATCNGKLTVTSPFDGREIATFEDADATAVEKALETAYSLYRNRDAWLPAEQRIDILRKSIAIMSERADELAGQAALEGGKPLIDSKIEVGRAIDSLRSCIETLRTDSGHEIPMNLNAASKGKLAVTRREPIGVVVAISAFNHPVNLIAHQVGPAIATGCPVIVKPALDTPISCYTLVEIFRQAGLPPEWCQAMVIGNRDHATSLATDSRVAFLSFIGSARVGWMLRSKLAPGTRCALEHGGAAPVIIEADADIEGAIAPLAKGGFYHAGQVCVSVQRLFAHESIARNFAENLVIAASKMTVGDPTKSDTDVGPLIRPAEVDRVENWVNEAVQAGAELITGGKRLSDSCYETTVLFDPPADAKVSQMEIFGPVVCVYPYKSLDEAIDRANSLPFSFQASVYTASIDSAMRAFTKLDASAVMVNEHTAFRVDWMPFAGLKASGLGTGGIPYSMRDMQVEKMLVLRSVNL